MTEDAVIVCLHGTGIVQVVATQQLVRINQRRVLVEVDPQGRSIVGCTNLGVGIKPCTATLVVQKGYSTLVRVQGRRVCLESVTGLTDGTPPGTVKYQVRRPGQALVGVDE